MKDTYAVLPCHEKLWNMRKLLSKANLLHKWSILPHCQFIPVQSAFRVQTVGITRDLDIISHLRGVWKYTSTARHQRGRVEGRHVIEVCPRSVINVESLLDNKGSVQDLQYTGDGVCQHHVNSTKAKQIWPTTTARAPATTAETPPTHNKSTNQQTCKQTNKQTNMQANIPPDFLPSHENKQSFISLWRNAQISSSNNTGNT